MTKTCPACGEVSEQTYRCEHCGHDLAGKTGAPGRGQEDPA